MKILLRALAVFVVFPGLIAAFLFHLDRTGFFNVEKIEVVIEGSQGRLHLQPLVADLKKELSRYEGKSLWRLKISGLSSTLSKQNWIEDHAIARKWPRSLVVKLVPEEVKALLVSGQNRLLPVVGSGQVLAPIEARLAPDVVVFEGKAFEDEAFRKKAVRVMEEIPERGAFSRASISEVRWSAKEGFSMTMMKTSTRVTIGEEAVALKAARLGQVLEYLENRRMKASSVDANLSKKVLVRLENAGSTVSF